MAEKRHPIWELYYSLERDTRAALAKLQELGILLSNTDLPEPTDVDCPICGLKTKGPVTLSEHLYLSHAGTVPETWERAAERSE